MQLAHCSFTVLARGFIMKEKRFFCIPTLERTLKTKPSINIVLLNYVEVGGIGFLLQHEGEDLDVEKIKEN